jgi:hypothetical protein
MNLKKSAKHFVKHSKEDVKIVKVEQLATNDLNLCYGNAYKHCVDTGSKMVCGYVFAESTAIKYGDSYQPVAYGAKHFWNKLNGKFFDTTPFKRPSHDFVHVLANTIQYPSDLLQASQLTWMPGNLDIGVYVLPDGGIFTSREMEEYIQNKFGKVA